MHLCAELTAAFWTLEPFGEIGANFSLQLSSRTRFDKINKKKVIAENQCEKHKLEDLKVLRRSPDLLNNVKIGQGQLQLIMKQTLFYHILGFAAILVK